MMFGTMEKRPAFEKYTAELAARPASQRANQINEDRIKSLED
jgi:glutathione S-transferase